MIPDFPTYLAGYISGASDEPKNFESEEWTNGYLCALNQMRDAWSLFVETFSSDSGPDGERI